MTPLRTSLAALVGLLAATLLAVPSSPATAVGATPCRGTTTSPPVVLLHDLAGTPASVAPLAAQVEAAGRCVVTVGWGPLPALALLPPNLRSLLSGLPGGLASLEDQAPVLAGQFTSIAGAAPARQVDVVAVGAGSLVALRAVQIGTTMPVRRLVSVGSLWDGTNIAGLGTLEQLSRDAGTYDLVLGVEKLLLDGVCASCREFIQGSDFLRRLQSAGLRPRGLQQVDIVSRTDGLVVPWTSGQREGVSTLVVQQDDPNRRVGHFGLPRDLVVQGLVVQALR